MIGVSKCTNIRNQPNKQRTSTADEFQVCLLTQNGVPVAPNLCFCDKPKSATFATIRSGEQKKGKEINYIVGTDLTSPGKEHMTILGTFHNQSKIRDNKTLTPEFLIDKYVGRF